MHSKQNYKRTYNRYGHGKLNLAPETGPYWRNKSNNFRNKHFLKSNIYQNINPTTEIISENPQRLHILPSS